MQASCKVCESRSSRKKKKSKPFDRLKKSRKRRSSSRYLVISLGSAQSSRMQLKAVRTVSSREPVAAVMLSILCPQPSLI